MEQTAAGVVEYKTVTDMAAGETPIAPAVADTGSAHAETGPAVESNPYVIFDGLRGEMDRVSLTAESSCICLVSPDGTVDDTMMTVLGDWITSSLRSIDVLYRIPGDKYLLVLRQVDRDGAVHFIKQMRERMLSEFPSVLCDDERSHVTASFGGTILDSMAPLHEHMDRAAEAHSWALKGKGDTICMWTPRF